MRLALPLIAVVLALPSVGRADDPAPQAPPTAEAIAKAKEHIAAGTQFYNVQQYDKAADEYQQAYLLDPKPEYLYASAQSQRLGGDCAKALLSYQAYLRTNPSKSEQDKAQKNIDRCEQEIKDHEAAVDSGNLSAQGDVPAPPPPPPVEPPPPPPPPGKSYVLGHLMVGTGAAALGAGIYFFLDGRGKISDHNTAPTYDEFAAGRGDIDTAKRNQTIGMSGIAVGGALIAGGILYYVVHAKSRTPSVSASISHDHAGLAVVGSF